MTSPTFKLRNSSATPPLAILIVFSIICCEINWERQSASLRRPSGVFLTLYLLSYAVLIIYICETSDALSDMSSLHIGYYRSICHGRTLLNPLPPEARCFFSFWPKRREFFLIAPRPPVALIAASASPKRPFAAESLAFQCSLFSVRKAAFTLRFSVPFRAMV